ncbi:flagellar biosynthesis protein FlhF [Reinekea sp. G2M2-21]|uniref:flagellar biosynthesis protein FlhF n=1 Tax=Reinekea sp. G2M2-21 TaxID=2788942 RepID=UPI0018AA50AB|nr:flagellar biosynthesis protein FlhF [Reinekea sp. G2M2-21]
MKIKRFTAANMQAGLKTISETLGPEAVILSNRRLANGLEIVAGVDEQEFSIHQQNQPPKNDSDIIKVNPQLTESLDKETMQQLFSVMSDKNKSAFDDVKTPVKMSVAPTHSRKTENSRSPQVLAEETRHTSRFEQSEPVEQATRMAEADIALLRREIDSLKDLLKEQTDQLREPVTAPTMTPQYERLEARLQTLGFGGSLIRKILANYDREDSLDQNWRRMMGRLASALPVPLYEPLSTGGVFALTGPTGAGKTTTIAKLAAHAVKDYGVDSVAIVSMDWYQVGGQEILKSVSDILGVSFKAMREKDSLSKVLQSFKGKRLVLIDTSGSSEALANWNQIMSFGELVNRVQTLLVLPATMLNSAVNQFIALHKNPVFTGTIVSKLDESSCFGGVLEPVMKHRWPLWYCTTGQSIPQDIEVADARKLIQRLVKGLTHEPAALASAS